MDSLHKQQAVIALKSEKLRSSVVFRLSSFVCFALYALSLLSPGAFAGAIHRYAAHFDLRIPAEPDLGPKDSSKGWMDDAVIHVPDHFTISDLDVKINVTHTKVFDLQVFIAGRAGTRVCLNMYDPYSEYFDGENYTQTIFDDEAATPIEQGEPPFTGRFRPRHPYRLSTFDGEDAFGPWRLQIYDAYHADTGKLHHAELIITAAPVPQPFTGLGSGTPQEPYIITDINELQQMNNDLDACYALACDIDARPTETANNGRGFTPIGNRLDCFTGAFQGGGHIIRNLCIHRPGDACVGLFGQAAGSVISNVGLVDLRITGGRRVGGLIGLNFGRIQEAYVVGSVQGREKVGGFAGANYGEIVNCYSCADVGGRPTGRAVGGFAGAIEQGTVRNCYCIAAITGAKPGGFAGLCNGFCLDCFWNTQTSAQSMSSCGLGLTTAQMKQQASFTGWDFDAVWGIIEGTTYPFLKRVHPAVPAEVPCPVVGECDVVRLADEWEIHPDPTTYDGDTPEPVHAVADGVVCLPLRGEPPAADDFFDVLIQHSYWGHVWWSGYAGLGDVQVCSGERVDSSSIIGCLPDSDRDSLGFAVYLPARLRPGAAPRRDVQLGLAAFDARIVPRRLPPSALSFKAGALARQVVGASYLCGGKGYDFDEARFVDGNDIRLDAPGLVFWAYNKAQGAAHYQQAHPPHNPVHYETVAGQCWNNCIVIDTEALMPGDLLFFDTPRRGLYSPLRYEQTGDKTAVDHVAMYVGDFDYPGGVIRGRYYPPGTYDCVQACAGGPLVSAKPVSAWPSQDGQASGVVPRTLSAAKIAPGYEDAGLLNDPSFFCAARVAEPTIAAVVYATGPVDVVLAEPNGPAITREMPEVGDRLYYSVFDIDGDGRLDDMVTIAAAQPGTYTVGMVEEPDALSADVFSLTLVARPGAAGRSGAGSEVSILAEGVQIRDIRRPGYQFTLCE